MYIIISIPYFITDVRFFRLPVVIRVHSDYFYFQLPVCRQSDKFNSPEFECIFRPGVSGTKNTQCNSLPRVSGTKNTQCNSLPRVSGMKNTQCNSLPRDSGTKNTRCNSLLGVSVARNSDEVGNTQQKNTTCKKNTVRIMIYGIKGRSENNPVVRRSFQT
jgi:hypothetical protein